MMSLRNGKKISYVLLLIAASLLITQLSLNARDLDLHILLSFLIIGICTGSIIPLWNKVESPKVLEDSDKKQGVFIFVSTALYGIIAGFAITNAITHAFTGFGSEIQIFPLFITFELIEKFIDETIRLSDQFAITMVFLATSIPFYHGAMRYLIRYPDIISSEGRRGQIIHFGGLFTQAIIFLGIALVLSSLSAVITLIIILLIVDSAWILLGHFTNHPPPKGWLSLNIAFFASINLISYPMWSEHALLILMGFAIIRSIIDYCGFQEIFFDKPFKR